MRYIYTTDNCPRCVALKKMYKDGGISYEERSADRIKKPEDNIDAEALVEASMNNMELPVIVDI